MYLFYRSAVYALEASVLVFVSETERRLTTISLSIMTDFVATKSSIIR